MLGDGWKGAVEGVEGSLEEAEGFHGGEWMWFWGDCRGSKFRGSG